MDNECCKAMFGHFLEGMNCVNCVRPTIVKPYNPVKKQVHQHKNKGLKIQVSADIDVNTSCMERNKCFIQWNISCKHQ